MISSLFLFVKPLILGSILNPPWRWRPWPHRGRLWVWATQWVSENQWLKFLKSLDRSETCLNIQYTVTNLRVFILFPGFLLHTKLKPHCLTVGHLHKKLVLFLGPFIWGMLTTDWGVFWLIQMEKVSISPARFLTSQLGGELPTARFCGL